MAYSWIEPKTDWTPTDKFTFTDYNRIRNNLLYINEKINTIYPDLYVELDLGEEKTDYADEYFPSEFNAFEDALLSFERTGKNYNLGERYYHYDNSPFAWDDVLNRLEKCTLRWKKISEIPVTRITVTPHDNKTSLLYIGDSAIFDVLVEPSNATKKDDWVIDTVSDKVKLEKINNTQIRATYIKGADVLQFRHGNYPYDELFITHKGDVELTIVAKIDNIKGRCDVGYRPQGSYSNSDYEYDNSYYYKFTKIADNVDGRGITTFLMTYSGFRAMPWGYTNRFDLAGAPWREAHMRELGMTFSLQLKSAMKSVKKELMTSSDGTTKGNLSVVIVLPSFKEFGSENQNVISLGSTYPYLANNELYFNKFDPQHNTTKIVTRSLYNASASSESNLPPDKRKALISSRTSSIETVPVDSLQDIYPMIFLQSNLHVEEYHEHYVIDWSGESDLTLADIPLGSIVFDVFGNKGDLSSFRYVEEIVTSKDFIFMNKGAVQTVTISTIPVDATYNNRYFNVWSYDESIVGVDCNGNTITIYGKAKGKTRVQFQMDEFPNNPFGGEIIVEVNEKTDVEEMQLPYSIKNGGSSCARATEMHIAGGGGRFEGVSDHWVYDGDNWTQSTDLPYPMFAGGLFCRNDSSFMILVGGISGSSWTYMDNCCDYSFSREIWYDYFDYPTSIVGIDSCIVRRDNYIYVLGSSTYIRTPSRGWSNRQNAIDIMEDGSAILYNNDIYFITSKTNYNSYLYKCTINSNHEIISYSRYCSLPHNNIGGKLAVTQRNGQDVMYYLGGDSSDKRYFKLVNGNFTQVGELKYPFRYGTACTFHGSIYCIGGQDSNLADKMYKILTY